MYDAYFEEWDVRPEFKKEFISLWTGWLGPENYYKLDLVTPTEWQRFNRLLALISERYDVFIADHDKRSCEKVSHTRQLTQSYEDAMSKDSSRFTKVVIPELGCVLTEEWEYTYILWHTSRAAVEALSPLVGQAELHHFGPDAT